MKPNILLLLIIIFSINGSIYSQEINYRLSADSLVNFHASNKRIYTTQRIQERPRIDGKLDDTCWKQEGYWDGDFIQQQPVQGRTPSQKTEIKILYDDDNLYVAIRCYDNMPEKISPILGRRDDFTSGDVAGIALDTYYDKTTAFEFNLTAAGQKIDLVHLGAYQWDTNWDAVWEGKVNIGDSLWMAEMRIPFSQLRYSEKEEQVWGMHVWRWIDRLDEESQWKLIPVDAPAMVYIFGELHGIRNIKQKRRAEIMPFVAARHFSGGLKSERYGYGIDGKIGISSNFTLDFTVLPDFGQVEADPSELNLTSYEVFYDEKRPFFLEGNSILDYSAGNDMLFYSRRIGHAPSYSPSADDHENILMPAGTTILNALKLTGKNSKGLSMGVINSMTSREFAEISDGNQVRQELVEPFTNYFIGRVKQDLNQSNTIIGGILTSTIRSIGSDNLKFLPESAHTAGFDLLHNWHNRKYFVEMKTFYSNLRGSEEAISALQTSNRHLFHRVDADHLEFDPSRTSLDGWGGLFRGGKQSGKFRVNASLSWRSPGVDLNDLGYLRDADLITQRVNLRYQVNQPKGIIRNYYITLDERNDWSFGGENLNTNLNLHGYLKFSNLWSIHLDAVRNLGKIDTRQLRGGPSLRTDPFSIAEIFLQTNSASKLFFGLGADKKWVDDQLGGSIDYTLHVQWKISNRFNLSLRNYYEELTDNNQYIARRALNKENRYLTGKLNRKTAYSIMRAEFFATPELSFQLYGSPYASVGKFIRINKVNSSLAIDPDMRYQQLVTVSESDGKLFLDETNNGVADYSIPVPDFNFREWRSNFVLRWEYKAGSTLYLVWTQNRSTYENIYEPKLMKSFESIPKIKAENAFMLKFSYWFTL
jgi:hypothetical protein